jgi:adenosylhomocysteine nucleosidase
MIGIITAVDTERDSVLQKMTGIKTIILYEIMFYQGFIHHTPCVTAMSGVGKVNAARCTQLMIDKFQPVKIVNLGSAGAIHPSINIGDVVISTACIQHDVDLTVFGIKKGAFDDQNCGFYEADIEFAELCRKAITNSIGKDFKIFSGVIATGDQFNDSPEKKNQLFEEFGAYCNEMEGAAVAQVCALCKIPFVVIRSISDTPGNESKMLYQNYKQLASERCADFLVNLIAIIEKSDPKLTIST